MSVRFAPGPLMKINHSDKIGVDGNEFPSPWTVYKVGDTVNLFIDEEEENGYYLAEIIRIANNVDNTVVIEYRIIEYPI